MDALIRYAGETRNFPGVEAARDAIEEMKEIPMAAGQQGRFTIGLAVANNEAAISHASTLIARAASEPEIRIIVHTDIDAVRDQLMHARETSLRSEEHTSELQSLMRISYAVFCLNKKKKK